MSCFVRPQLLKKAHLRVHNSLDQPAFKRNRLKAEKFVDSKMPKRVALAGTDVMAGLDPAIQSQNSKRWNLYVLDDRLGGRP
jgi:hypothetical protein